MRNLVRIVALMVAVGVFLSAALAQEGDPDKRVTLRAKEPVLLVGALKYLAQQAGYELAVPMDPVFFRRAPVEVAGEFVAVVTALLGEQAPGYRLEGEPPHFRVARAPAGENEPAGAPKEAGSSKGPPAAGDAGPAKPTAKEGKALEGSGRYLILGADGNIVEGEMPPLAVAIVVDGVATVKDGVVDLVISPLGPACLYRNGEKVCLRALTPGLEGELPVRVGGEQYTVRYRVVADAVVLYRYSLNGPLPAREPGVTPKPLAPPPPTKDAPPKTPPGEKRPAPQKPAAPSSPKPVTELTPGVLWLEGHEVTWRSLSLASSQPAGKWLSVGAFRKAEGALSLFHRMKELGLRPGIWVKRDGLHLVVVPDSPETRQTLGRARISFSPANLIP